MKSQAYNHKPQTQAGGQYQNDEKFYLQFFHLHNFRNYENLTITPAKGINVIYGDNGSGKTNFLEAISLFSPNSGLRSKKTTQLFRHHTDSFQINLKSQGPIGLTKLTLRAARTPDEQNDKRRFFVDSQPLKRQGEIVDSLRQVSIESHIEQLPSEGTQKRRRFFDRIIALFYPDHARWLLKYEKATRARQQILRNHQLHHTSWLKAIEQQMAESAAILAERRLQFTEIINKESIIFQQNNRLGEVMPRFQLRVSGFIEDLFKENSAVEAEDRFIQYLAQKRQQHGIAAKTGGKLLQNNHAVDIQLFDVKKNCSAEHCSTGERKLLLTALIFTQLFLMRRLSYGFLPILLLDELAAHLDKQRRILIFEEVQRLNMQAFITGTERKIFGPIEGRAKFFHCRQNNLLEQQNQQGKIYDAN